MSTKQRKEIINKTLKLNTDFINYSVKNPEILEEIPENSYVSFLNKTPKKFEIENLERTRETAQREGKSFVAVIKENANRWIVDPRPSF